LEDLKVEYANLIEDIEDEFDLLNSQERNDRVVGSDDILDLLYEVYISNNYLYKMAEALMYQEE
jgi:hypothetical protein